LIEFTLFCYKGNPKLKIPRKHQEPKPKVDKIFDIFEFGIYLGLEF